MIADICPLTQQSIVSPVVSKITGHIYEKHAIEKHVESTGLCPKTCVPMSKNDLISINKDRLQVGDSRNLKSCFDFFKNEFDTLSVQNYLLQKQIQEMKIELQNSS